MTDKLQFKRKTEVQAYLVSQGYDLGGSALNSTLAKKLDGIAKKNGYWQQADIDNLAKFGNIPRLDGAMPKEMVDLDKRIKEAEAREREGRAAKIEHENKVTVGLYLLRSEVDRQFAARAAFLKDGVGSRFIHSRAPRIVEMIGGDMGKVPDLVELWLKEVEELFDHYSKPLEFEAVNIIVTEDTE